MIEISYMAFKQVVLEKQLTPIAFVSGINLLLVTALPDYTITLCTRISLSEQDVDYQDYLSNLQPISNAYG